MTSFKEQISAIMSSTPDPIKPVLLYFFAILKKCYAAAYHIFIQLMHYILRVCLHL